MIVKPISLVYNSVMHMSKVEKNLHIFSHNARIPSPYRDME